VSALVADLLDEPKVRASKHGVVARRDARTVTEATKRPPRLYGDTAMIAAITLWCLRSSLEPAPRVAPHRLVSCRISGEEDVPT
jgi:hypothetical protein